MSKNRRNRKPSSSGKSSFKSKPLPDAKTKSKPKPKRNPKPKPKLKGSKKHIQDWLQTRHMVEDLNGMLGRFGVEINLKEDAWMPNTVRPQSARLELSNAQALLPDPDLADQLASWWLAHPEHGNVPYWDLAVSCKINNRPGLILTEAVAHQNQLNYSGKVKPKPDSRPALENHERMSAAMEESKKHLSYKVNGIKIGIDTHYILSSRLALVSKLASMGIPVILLYLGFTGDKMWNQDMIQDRDHWLRIMGAYLNGVLPLSLPDHPIRCGKAEFTLVIRSRPVLD